jgi:hypothetical protein
MCRRRLEALRTNENGVGIELTTPFVSEKFQVWVRILPEVCP